MPFKKIEIKEPCFVGGELASVGDVLEVDENDASHMVGNGRAVYAEANAKVGPAKVPKEEAKA
jgi:hypothetical protein